MIYLIAYITNDTTVLALNEKGQFVGSKEMAETIKMLPAYNWYTKEDPDLKKSASQSEFAMKACVVQIESVANAFQALDDKHSRYIGASKVRFASIKSGYGYLFTGVGIKATV